MMRAALVLCAVFLASAHGRMVLRGHEDAALDSSAGDAIGVVQDWDARRRTQEVEIPGDEGFGPESSPPPVYGSVDVPSPPTYGRSPPRPRGKAATRAPPVGMDPPAPTPPSTPPPYRLKCEGEGYIIRAGSLNPKSPYVHFKVTHANTNADNSIACEAECFKADRCKSFYYKRDGNCWLFKGYGKFIDGGYDTVRACQLYRD